jgi:hypothetical protein
MSETLTIAEYYDLVELFCAGTKDRNAVRLLSKRYSKKTLEVAVRKIAIGYPPSQEHYPASMARPVRRRVMFNRAEQQIIKWWYDVQSDFNDEKLVAYWQSAERTKDWCRPSVAYICRVLCCLPSELRNFVFSTHLKPRLVPLKCPVPEWQ